MKELDILDNELKPFGNWDFTLDLVTAKRNEAHHRKQMEYFQEEIEILKEKIKEDENNKKRIC